MSLVDFLFGCNGKSVMVKIIGAIEVIYPIEDFECVEHYQLEKFAFGSEGQEDYPFEIWKSTIKGYEILTDLCEDPLVCTVEIVDNGYVTKLELSLV